MHAHLYDGLDKVLCRVVKVLYLHATIYKVSIIFGKESLINEKNDKVTNCVP